MQITRTLNTDENTLYHFIHSLADEDAKQPVKAGTVYKKMLVNVKGVKQKVKVTVDAIEPGLYQVSIDQNGDHYLMRYSWKRSGHGKVDLVYEETAALKKATDRFSQKLNTLLNSFSTKRRINERLDIFEKALEGFEWHD